VKKLKRLWRALEQVPGLLGVLAVWDAECGDEFDLRPHLRATDIIGSAYPCPVPDCGDCPRKIIDHGDGEFVAICRDPHKVCADVRLSANEALVRELDLDTFLTPILQAASIRAESVRPRGQGIWSVGLSNRRSSLNQPVFLLISMRSEVFHSAVRDLLLEVPGPFVIVAPTNRHRNVDLQERLQARGVGYLCLEDQLLWDDRRGFSSVDPLESADKIPVTPIADRRRAVREFRSKNKCKVADIQRAAGVDESDYYRWLKGSIPDRYSTCIDIERVLHLGFQKSTSKLP
jgi:hypothetical protein